MNPSSAIPMKKAVLVISFVISCVVAVTGRSVSPDDALARALSSETPARRMVASPHDYALSWSDPAGGVYVFTDGQGNMTVAPADDSYPAVLGYAVSAWGEIPSALEAFLLSAGAGVAAGRNPGLAAASQERPPVLPLVEAEWGQRAPYNGMCPVFKGERTVTGCVATAMAQIMSYWRYPRCGTGVSEYQWTSGESLRFNFDEHPFDWENMLPSYTGSATVGQPDAVATLMAACGAAVQMRYGLEGSASYDEYVGQGLASYLGYDDGMAYISRSTCRAREWTDRLYDELAAGRPVLYMANSERVGHAFVCDGYEYRDGADYFHINWGWDGRYNGYFLTDVLDPYSDDPEINNGAFISSQRVLVGIRPDDGVESEAPALQCYGRFRVGDSRYPRHPAGLMDFIVDMRNTGVKALTGCPGIKIVSEADGGVEYAGAPECVLRPQEYCGSFQINTDAFVKEGTYIVSPAFLSNGKWTDVPQDVTAANRMVAVVDDASIRFEVSDASCRIEALDFTVPNPEVVNGEPFKIEVTFRSYDFDGPATVTPSLVDGWGRVVARMSSVRLSLADGKSETVCWDEVFSPSVPPGSYKLMLAAGPYQNLVAAEPWVIVVDVASPPLVEIADAKINGEPSDSWTLTAISGTDMAFSFTLRCTRGTFDGEVYVEVCDMDGTAVDGFGEPARVVLQSGDKTALTFADNMDWLDPKAIYWLVVKVSSPDGDILMSEEYPFSVPMAALDDVRVDDAEAAYYTISGVALPGRPTSPGVYITLRPGIAPQRIIVR